MSRLTLQPSVSSPRLLASAIGMAVTAMSASQMAHAAEEIRKGRRVAQFRWARPASMVRLPSPPTTKPRRGASQKYTAPLLDTRLVRSPSVPQQVLKDTAADFACRTRCAPYPASPSAPARAVTLRATVRSFAASMPRATPTSTACATPARRAREIFDIESIEVSKGPNSAMGGRGSAGGSLNLVTKMPKANDFTDGSFTYGTDQTRRYTLDVNRKFLDDRRVPAEPDEPRAERCRA
jgi:catecholate siderophore receptor